ncbi:MAG TPA: hypothetical protein VF183_12530 [Acidimicrobiales bacterium]
MTDRVPVIAGVAQLANKDDERIVHPVELIEQTARAALDDAGISVDRVGAVLATPLTIFGTENAAELVAAQLGLGAASLVESGYSGASPQQLLTTACDAVAAGELDAALVVGGIADASVRRARRRGLEPPAPPTALWSQGSDGVRGIRVRPPAWQGKAPETAAGTGMPAAFFALIDSAIGAGMDPAAHRTRLGELLAPFTEVASRRPDVAWFPEVRDAESIATVRDDNRLVAEPYTKLMCSFPTVDLAAAVVVTAARPGRDRDVRPLSLVSAKEARPPSGRPEIGRSRALERAAHEALRLAATDVSAIDLFDFYSCFPAAVQLASAAFGLRDDDPRQRTVAGGLPYFGGPGASYSLHAIVSLVEELRARPDALGAIVGLGGMANDFSVGVYGGADVPYSTAALGELEDGAVELRDVATGPATVDAMTVLHDRDRGPVAAPVVARLADGSRVGAQAADPELPPALSGTTLVGREVILATVDGKTVYALP